MFCADLPEFVSDDELAAKLTNILGRHDVLLETPEVAKQALAAHGITAVHVHRVSDEVVHD